MRMTFDEAATQIRQHQQSIRDAMALVEEATLPAVIEGAQKRIRMYEHGIAAIFTYFDADTRTRLEKAVQPEAAQSETLF